MPTIEQRVEYLIETELLICEKWRKWYENCALSTYEHLLDLQKRIGTKGNRWITQKDIGRAEAVFEDYVTRANAYDEFIRGEGGKPEPEHMEEVGWYPESDEDPEDKWPTRRK